MREYLVRCVNGKYSLFQPLSKEPVKIEKEDRVLEARELNLGALTEFIIELYKSNDSEPNSYGEHERNPPGIRLKGGLDEPLKVRKKLERELGHLVMFMDYLNEIMRERNVSGLSAIEKRDLLRRIHTETRNY